MTDDSNAPKPRGNPVFPIEYLVSEIVAFPLAAVQAFENPISRFDPEMTGGTGTLWRNAELHILQSVPNLSIDMALAIRDQFWFGKGDSKPYPDPKIEGMLHRYVRRVAGQFLNVLGDFAVPRFVGNESLLEREKEISSATRRNNILRWFSFSLPMDLLMGALNGKHNLPTRIDYLSPQIFANLNEKGYAETHLHLGASLEFPEFWVTTLNRFALMGIADDLFKSPGATMNEGEQLAPWLLRAAFARSLLAHFLFSRKNRDINLTDWLYRVAYPGIRKLRGGAVLEVIRRGLMELAKGKKLTSGSFTATPFLLGCYRDIICGKTLEKLKEQPEAIHHADPIAFLTGYSPGRSPTPEMQFVNRGISYLEMHEKKNRDKLFSALFWQVIRLRCIYYRHVTQRPMTPGLLWFVRHYDRMSPGRKTVGTGLLVKSAALTCGLGKGLRSLEVRKSPGDSVSGLLELVHDGITALRRPIAKSRQELYGGKGDSHTTNSRAELLDDLEFGWVFHFAKLRGGDNIKGLDKPGWQSTHADPAPLICSKPFPFRRSRNRYAEYYRKIKATAMALARLIFNFPNSLKVVRGVDVCTDELGVPSWVLGPSLRYVRDAGKAASHFLRAEFGDEVTPMGITVHTGEDFVHLLGGIRRVEESVRYFKLGPGDRIGHGIALGMDPVTWARRAGRVAMRREDRLMDLVWEWSQYSTHTIPCDASRWAYVKREISRLSKSIFSEPLEPYALEELLTSLHDETSLKHIGFPDCEYRPSRYKEHLNNKYSLLRRYLTDPEVFRWGHEVEWIGVEPEIAPMTALQNYVRQKIATLGLVVEVNPTSNLLIGNLTDLKNHPFWRLNPPTGLSDLPPVALCIGSDDPLTFATNLRREYALLYESLVDGGLSSSQACEWVDKIREMGMNSRFTRKLTPSRHLSRNSVGYYNRFRNMDRELPRSCWALGLDEYVPMMP